MICSRVARSAAEGMGDSGPATDPIWIQDRVWESSVRWGTIERIASVSAPLLVIAGDRDDIVPLSLSRRLYDAAAEPKRFVLVPGAGHNDPALLDGPQMLGETQGFLSSTGLT